MSSRGEIERIRLVGKVVDDYNAAIPTMNDGRGDPVWSPA
jgi:hypothetical protein